MMEMTRRNVIRYRRIPQLLVFSTIQPVMFLLLFTYVFGGAIRTPGVDYVDFLLPGIFLQTVLFGSIQTGIGLASDLASGIIDRFRSLPMARSAVLAGRVLSDSLRNVFVLILMTLVGLIIGFKFNAAIPEIIGGYGMALLFGFAFSWVAAVIGLAVREPETAQVAGFIWVFPLVFVSSAFVPTDTMPKFLEILAEHSPISYTINSVRALLLDLPSSGDVLYSLLWIGTIIALFVPLSVWLYRRT